MRTGWRGVTFRRNCSKRRHSYNGHTVDTGLLQILGFFTPEVLAAYREQPDIGQSLISNN
jgi:hypothetical protein